MKAWAYWFPDLAPQVAGCPNVMMVHELRRTAQALFRESRAWKVDQALKPITAGTGSLDVIPDDPEQDLVRVEAAWYDGLRMDPITPESLDELYPHGWHDMTGTPDRYFEQEDGVLRLFPLPLADAVTGLKLRLSVSPGEESPGLPDNLAVRYREELHVGAKARLMLMEKKAWTNLQMAGVYAQSFTNMVARATYKAARGHVQARIPSRPTWC